MVTISYAGLDFLSAALCSVVRLNSQAESRMQHCSKYHHTIGSHFAIAMGGFHSTSIRSSDGYTSHTWVVDGNTK